MDARLIVLRYRWTDGRIDLNKFIEIYIVDSLCFLII